jgi:hypothetical protein
MYGYGSEQEAIETATVNNVTVSEEPAKFLKTVAAEVVIYHIMLAPEIAARRDGDEEHSSTTHNAFHFPRGEHMILDMLDDIECADYIERLVRPRQVEDRALYYIEASPLTGQSATVGVEF